MTIASKCNAMLLAINTSIAQNTGSGHMIEDHDDTIVTGAQLDELVSGDVTVLHNHTGATSYTDRGDPSSVDFSKTAFTTDGQWHTLDLSGIVPEGATLIHLLVYTFNSFANSWIFFCKKGNTNRTVNRAPISIRQGGNIEYYESVFVACDENRQIEYMMTNRVWDGALDMVVRGWI